MIQTITYNNPINNVEESLVVDIDMIYMDWCKWQNDQYLLQNKDLYDILDGYLVELDCSRVFKCGRPMMLCYTQYKIILSEFLKLLNKFPGYSIYNEYIDKFINLHENNIKFEFENPIVKKKPTKAKKEKDKPNKWTKAVTNDIFTGEERYIYENIRTGELITSSNPDLLDTLNAPKKKEKKTKVVSTDLNFSVKGTVFNFKALKK